MVSREQLRLALHLGQVDLEDLVELLIGHFHGARHESPQELVFPNDGEAMLTLLFSKDLRRCEAAVAGAGFDETALAEVAAKVEEELIASTGPRYGTVVLFSLEPVVGSWRYEDRLQLRPLPEQSPRPPFSYAAHPLAMDFVFQGAGDIMTAIRRRQRVAARWTQRLNVLVRPALEMGDNNARYHWVFVPQPDGKLLSQYLQEGYAPEGLTYDEHAMPPSTAELIERVSADAYYAETGTSGQPLSLPASLEHSISMIEGLPAEVLLRFDRAAYWFYYATHLAGARSVMAIALGAAIEALFEPDPHALRCRECKRELRGPTVRFVDFMSTHLPTDDAESARRLFAEFYGLRSRPAHGQVFDTDFHPLPTFTPARLEEDEQVRTLFSYVRIALVNWLESRKDSPAGSETATSSV